MARRDDPPKGRLLFTDFDASSKGRPPAALDDDTLPMVSTIEELSRHLDLDFEEDGDYLPGSVPSHSFAEPRPEPEPAPPPPPSLEPESEPLPDDPNATALLSRSLVTSALNQAFPQPRIEDWSRVVDSVFAAPADAFPDADADLPDEFFAASFQPFDGEEEEGHAAVLADFDPENDDILSVLPPQTVDERYQPYEGEYRGQRLGVAAPRERTYGGIKRLDEWYRPPEEESEEEQSLRRENWYEPPDSVETAKTMRLEKPPSLPAGAPPSQSRRGSSTSTSATDMFRDLDIDDIWRERTGESAQFGEGTVILDTDDLLKDPRMAKLAQAQAEARAASQRLSARRKTEIKAITPEKQSLKTDLAFADEEPERPAPRKPTQEVRDEEAFADLDKLLEADADVDTAEPSALAATAEEPPVADESGSAAGDDVVAAGSWDEVAASAFDESEPDYLPESDAAMAAVHDPDAEAEAEAVLTALAGEAGVDIAAAEPEPAAAEYEPEEELELTEPLDPFAATRQKKSAQEASAERAEGRGTGTEAGGLRLTEEDEEAGAPDGQAEGEPQEEAVAVDPMSVFANMDDMDFSDDGLDDDMKAMLDDEEEPEEGAAEGGGQAGVAEEQPPDGKIARILFYARKTVKLGPRGILRKLGEMLAWRENWWFYCDLLAAVIASASLAVILSYFLWYRG